jgi:DNA-binding beta-propeller fold protein YncE
MSPPPIILATNTAGTPINTGGAFATGVAITPDGKTAYVTNNATHSVTPITVATNTAGTLCRAKTRRVCGELRFRWHHVIIR